MPALTAASDPVAAAGAPASAAALLAGPARAALRGGAIKLGAECVGRLLSLATTVAIARSLGVREFGRFAALSGLAVVLAELAEFGLQHTAARGLVSGEIGLRSLARARLALSALLAAAVAAALAAASTPAGVALLARVGLDGGSVELLAWLVAFFVLAGWCEFLGVALRCRERRLAEVQVGLALRTCGLLAVAAAAAQGAPLRGIVIAGTLSVLPALVLALLLARPWVAEEDEEAKTRGLLGVLGTALPLAINGKLALLSLRIEVWALVLLRGAWEAGLFAAALKLVEPLLLVPAALGAGAMPDLTREAVAGAGDAVRRAAALAVALLAAPVAAGLALVGPGVLPALFGAQYGEAASLLPLLAPALFFMFVNALLLPCLIAAGRAARVPWLTAARTLAAVAGAVLLIPRAGLVGAAGSLVGAEALLTLLGWDGCRRAGFTVPVGRSLGLAVAATLPMVALLSTAAASPAAAVALGAAAYAATLLVGLRLRRRSLLAGVQP